MNDQTPQEWASILKRVVDSQNLEEDDLTQQLIAVKNNRFCIVNQIQIDSLTSELTLRQIVDVSIKKLKEVQEGYFKNVFKETDSINLTNDIADDTLQLIDDHENKRNHSGKQLLRKCAFVLSALFSLIIIGIPFFLALRKENITFRTEMDSLKQSIHQSQEENLKTILTRKLNSIPALLANIKKQFTDHRREELINIQLLNDWLEDESIPLNSRAPYDAEFESDIKAGASFQRIDKALNIEDQERLPSLQLNAEQRVKDAAGLLKKLLTQPNDQKWKSILQLAVTHASLFTAFKAVLSAFNIEASKIQWKTNGKYYSIKSMSSDEFPPVLLEIVRHPKSGTIEQVNVTVKGNVDIVSYDTSEQETPKIIMHDAIIEELKYSIIFGEDKRPAVRDLHSRMEANNLNFDPK